METMSLKKAVKSVFFENYANFRGRARRSEFWYAYLAFCLFAIVVVLIFMAIGIAIAVSSKNPAMAVLWPVLSIVVIAIPTFVPVIAVIVRRLHDIGKSGWWYLWLSLIGVTMSVIQFLGSSGTIVSFVGSQLLTVWWIIWLCKDSQPNANKWGPNPKL